ncbi:MAG: hypothetical protein KY475_02510 [Planctomycetes bacterium]|nr:hypothetical protein [Planctomycetota bacterium]
MTYPINPNQPQELSASSGETRMFSVQVGHTTTKVPGRTPAEAIHEARRRLCQEHPRMWDMIQKLDDSRFVVLPVK